MSTRRAQKAAEAIREVVSMAILADLQDPRIRDVTVTYVEASGDLRHAKVHVSVMGDEARQNLSSALSNLVFKCAAVAILGHRKLLLRVAAAFGLSMVVGVLLLALWP